MSTDSTSTGPAATAPRMDFATFWRSLPNAGLFLCWLVAWTAVFQFWGNSTLGYVKSTSLFRWWWWTMSGIHDQELAYVIPAIVLGLIWWQREEIAAMPKRIWWPALALFLLAVLMHLAGYRIQQARVSVVAYFAGVYALTGLLWGWTWLRATVLPFALLAFCVPLGSGAEPLTVPLRLLATKITAILCHLLGVDVIQRGNLLLDATGEYQYEVAAACSGIQSLTTVLAFGIIWGYVGLKSTWRRMLVTATAIPMAVGANVCRLTMMILASETFGHRAGDYVHNSSWLSLVPYIPAFCGIALVTFWLRENRKGRAPRSEPALLHARLESKS